MLKKQFILFAVAVLLLAGFFILPRNREWGQHIISYYSDFQTQKKHTDKESRMRMRFGNSYTLSKGIAAGLIKKTSNRNALVLVPPPAYFTNKGIDYPVPEPSVFYYYTGIKTTRCQYKDAINANWYVRIDHGKIVIDSVIDKKSLQDTIVAFLKWKRSYE